MRSAERGLTMLEVLGAAALLAFAYIALVRSEIEGLRAEQEAKRRLEASLLADERMSDLELAIASGAAPPLGEREEATEEEAPFRVVTSVRAFEPPPPREEVPHAAGPDEGSLAAKRLARTVDPDAPSLFAAPKPTDANPPLRTIEVIVRWDEGAFEREVRRTTFALDPVVTEDLLAQVQATAGGDEGEKAKDEESEGEGGEKGKGKGKDGAAEAPELDLPQTTGPDGGPAEEPE